MHPVYKLHICICIIHKLYYVLFAKTAVNIYEHLISQSPLCYRKSMNGITGKNREQREKLQVERGLAVKIARKGRRENGSGSYLL